MKIFKGLLVLTGVLTLLVGCGPSGDRGMAPKEQGVSEVFLR